MAVDVFARSLLDFAILSIEAALADDDIDHVQDLQSALRVLHRHLGRAEDSDAYAALFLSLDGIPWKELETIGPDDRRKNLTAIGDKLGELQQYV